MKSGHLTPLSLFALALLLLTSVLSAGIAITNIVLSPSVLHPGTSGVISLTVQNSDNDQAYAVALRGGSPDGPVRASGTVNLGDFRAGVSSSVNFPFSIPNTTRAGIYTLVLQFDWTNSTSGFTKPVMIPITVTDPAIFSAEAQNSTVFTSGDFSLPVRLTNRGGGASEVRVAINSTQFFQTGPNPLWVGDLGNASVPVSLGVSLSPDVSSGTYSLPLVLSYRDASGQDAVSSVYLRITVKRKSPQFSVSVLNANNLYPGRTVDLQATLANIGDETAYGARVRLSNNSALTPLQNSDISLGDLSPGENMTVHLNVGVNDVSPGFYSPTLSLSYRNANGDEQAPSTIPLGLSVESLSDVSVFVTAKPAPVVGGGLHTLSVTVSNTGSSPIKALAIQLQPSAAFMLQEAQDQQFIGGLNQDDFSSVQFKIQVADVPDGQYPVNVSLTFKDSYNRLHTAAQTVQLKVVSKKTAAQQSGEGNSALFAIGFVLLVVVLLALIWWFFFRKKKTAPAQGSSR